jgi:hypothetical protein
MRFSNEVMSHLTDCAYEAWESLKEEMLNKLALVGGGICWFAELFRLSTHCAFKITKLV